MSELVTTTPAAVTTATPQRSFFAMEPKQQIAYASEIATVLADVIDKQKLYSNIQGKNYVKVEGWQTLGTFLGIIPKERSVSRLSDGSYEAFVDLIKFADGTVVGGGSALCSVAEKRWGNADEYARRSMAITRATGKAFRSAFSWIITLAGYEATPEEEIPREAAAAPKNVSGTTQPRNLNSELKGAEVGRDGTIKKSGYDPNDPKAVEYLQTALEGYPDLPKSKYLDVEKAMIGKQSFKLPEVVKAVMGGANG